MSATKRVLAIQFTVGFSLALLIAAITLLIRVETPRQILEEVLHRPVEIQYRMAVLAARRGAYEESISLFQQVLQRSHGREDVLADYFFCLSWARRYKDLLDVYGQLPPSLRAQKEYLLAATIATLALKDYGRVSKLIGQSARAADDPVLALLALPNEMRRILGPNSEPIAGRLLETESAHYRAFAAQRQAAIRSRQGDLKAALSLIEQACSEPDVAPEALFDRVVILSWADRHAEAIARYRVLPDLGDRPTFLLEAAARSYREMGRRDLALDLYRQILRREPGHDRALDAALGLLLDADRLEEARALLGDHEPATRSSSATFDAHRARIAHQSAVLLARNGSYDEAIAQLRELSRHSVRGAQVAPDLAVVQSWAGEHLAATKTFEALPDRMSTATYVQLNMARSYRALRRTDVALRLYVDILRANPDHGDGLSGLKALLLEKRSEFLEPGLKRLDQTSREPEALPPWIAEYPWVDPRHARAVDLARQGNQAEALRVARQVLEDGASRPRLAEDFLVLLYLAGRYEEVARLSVLAEKEDTRQRLPRLLELSSVAYRAIGQPGRALHVAKRWLREYPEEPRSAVEVLHCLLSSGKPGEIERLIRGAQSKTAREILRAELHLSQDRLPEAEEIFARQFQNAEDAEGLLGLVGAMAGQGNDQRAIEQIGQALEHASIPEFLVRRRLPREVLLGFSRVLTRLGRREDALRSLQRLLAEQPGDLEALSEVATLEEARGHAFEVLRAYDRLLSLSPDDARAIQGRQRTILRLSAVGLIAEEWRSRGTAPTSMALRLDFLQRKALQRLSWQDFDAAEPLLLALEHSDPGEPEEGAVVVIHRAERRFEEAIAEYERLQRDGTALSDVALHAAADSYLELDRPEEALAVYRALEDRLQSRAVNRYPENRTVRMAELKSLVRLLRYEEATALLERMDEETPGFVEEQRTVRPNWHKAELAMERGWLLLAQNRLAEAEATFEELAQRAPANGAALSGLAHARHLRGWPRLAEQSFRSALAIAPDDLSARVGYAHVLLENGDEARAGQLALELSKSHPYDTSVRDLGRALVLGRATELSAETSFAKSTTSDFEMGVGVRQPVHARLALLGNAAWRQESREEDGWITRLRGAIGLGCASRDFDLVASATLDSVGRLGAQGRLSLALSDRISFGAEADSNTWLLPPKAMQNEISAQHYSLVGSYRHSELLFVEARGTLLALSDQNTIGGGQIVLEWQAFRNGRWQVTLGADAIIDRAHSDRVSYYSPRLFWSAMATPAIECLIWQRKRHVFSHRLEAGLGLQREANYGFDEQWLANYEQIHRFGDQVELAVDAGLSSRAYGGRQVLTGRAGVRSRILF